MCQDGWKRGLEENGYMCMYGWVPWLFTWNYHNIVNQLSSVQFSCSVVSNSLQPHESQHARPPCPSLTPGVYSNSCPSSRWCHPLSSPSPPAPSPCQHQGLFQWVNSSHEVAKVLEFQLQHQSFQWTPRTYLLYSNKKLKVFLKK